MTRIATIGDSALPKTSASNGSTRLLRCLGAACFVLFLCSGVAVSTANAVQQSKGGKAKSAYRRLPMHFGKLELKPEQIEEIYDIRESYGEKITKLQKEIASLRKKQTTEMNDVLTSTQQSALKKLKAPAKKPGRKSKSSASRKKPSTGSKSKSASKTSEEKTSSKEDDDE